MKKLIKVNLGFLFIMLDIVINNLKNTYIKTKLKHHGSDVFFHPNVSIINPGTISIGDHTHVGEKVHIRGGGKIEIGNWCQIANNVIIISGGHPIDGGLYYGRNIFSDIYIGDNVWIGSGAIILPGVQILNNSVVAAGAVVTSDIPSNVVVAGVPAKIIKTVPICVA
jgi:acetyltransferase-like isoleucine patch superfamily enzyme